MILTENIIYLCKTQCIHIFICQLLLDVLNNESPLGACLPYLCHLKDLRVY